KPLAVEGLPPPSRVLDRLESPTDKVAAGVSAVVALDPRGHARPEVIGFLHGDPVEGRRQPHGGLFFSRPGENRTLVQRRRNTTPEAAANLQHYQDRVWRILCRTCLVDGVVHRARPLYGRRGAVVVRNSAPPELDGGNGWIVGVNDRVPAP